MLEYLAKGVISDASKVSSGKVGISSGASTDADGKRRGEPSKRRSSSSFVRRMRGMQRSVGSSDAGGKNGEGNENDGGVDTLYIFVVQFLSGLARP